MSFQENFILDSITSMDPIQKSNVKSCPRCAHEFECKAHDILHCNCTKLELSEETRLFLSKTNYDCLCPTCLVHYESLNKQTKGQLFPKPNQDLIEGYHYYMEGNAFVFTEMYHYLRQYCCKSGCRHCVYGFKRLGSV